MLISGCAGGVKSGEPATTASAPPAATGGSSAAGGPAAATPPATTPPPGTTPPPAAAPAAAGPCNPSIDAARGTTVTDTGACPGVMPAAPSCAGDLVICSGVTSSSLGPGGNSAAAAAINGRGGLALGCESADAAQTFFSLYLPMPSGFVSRAPLGAQAWATQDGFISVSRTTGPSPLDFRAQDGSELASAPAAGRLFAGAQSIVALRAVQQGADVLLTAQGYASTGAPLLDAQPVATIAGTSAGSLMLGGAAATDGRTLLIWQVYGQSGAFARWVAADGTAASEPFALQGWVDHVPDAAALPGGAVAIAALPGSGTTWRGVVAAGATVEQPAPSWLSSRGAFHLYPDGRAMIFGTEVLADGGTVCGTLDLGAPLLGVGADGTAVTARDQKTFRIYPQLLR